MSGIIKGLGGWLKNSFIDFPGTVSTVLFFNKCNLRCPYCHNPDLLFGEMDKEHLSEEVWSFLKKRKGIIKGVVLSGGEPTIFSSALNTSRKIKDLGYNVKLDTNGLNPDMILKIEPDYLALDLKSDFATYEESLGTNISDLKDRLLQSIEIVKHMGDKAEIRITAAPGLINEDSINEISSIINGVCKIYLQRISYRNKILDEEYFKSVNREVCELELENYRKILSQNCKICEIR